MPPQVTPSEKKIWIQASAQTWTWRIFKSLVLSSTHIDLQQLLPLGGEVEGDPVHVAGKGGGPYQQDHQDAVGEQCCEVHQLNKISLELNLTLCLYIENKSFSFYCEMLFVTGQKSTCPSQWTTHGPTLPNDLIPFHRAK